MFTSLTCYLVLNEIGYFVNMNIRLKLPIIIIEVINITDYLNFVDSHVKQKKLSVSEGGILNKLLKHHIYNGN